MDTNSQTRRLWPQIQTVGQEGWYYGCKIITLRKDAVQKKNVVNLGWSDQKNGCYHRYRQLQKKVVAEMRKLRKDGELDRNNVGYSITWKPTCQHRIRATVGQDYTFEKMQIAGWGVQTVTTAGFTVTDSPRRKTVFPKEYRQRKPSSWSHSTLLTPHCLSVEKSWSSSSSSSALLYWCFVISSH